MWSSDEIRPSPGTPESLVSLGEEVGVGLQMPGVGDGDATAVESEEAVLEHRPVVVAEKPQTQFDRQVRADAQDGPVEGGVVEGAERQPIGHDGLATRVTIGQDVGGGQELASSEATT